MAEELEREASMIERLRQKIADTRYVLSAFDVAITDKDSTKGLVEFDGTNFILDPTGGRIAKPATFNVSKKGLDSIAELSTAISATPGWASKLDINVQSNHRSSDLLVSTPIDVKNAPTMFKTRRFSNEELSGILLNATQRHNQQMTLDQLPESELALVLTVAHAESLYRMASDSTKRSGLDSTVKDLLDLARTLDKQYTDDLTRLNLYSRRSDVLDAPDTAQTLHGDITVGQGYRVSPRTGWVNTAYNTNPPDLQELEFKIVKRGGPGKDFIQFNWRRPHLYKFGLISIYQYTNPHFTLITKNFTGGVFPDPSDVQQVYSTFDQRINFARIFGGQPGAPSYVSSWNYDTMYYYKVFLIDTAWAFFESEPFAINVPA